MSNIKIISCHVDLPYNIEDEFNFWKEYMKFEEKKIIKIINTSITANRDRLFMVIVYDYSIICVRKILVERKIKPKKRLYPKVNEQKIGRLNRERLCRIKAMSRHRITK